MRSLPDPDPILRGMGKNIGVLRELLVDSHLESLWSVRCSAASGAQWFIGDGEGGGTAEQEAADSFNSQLKALDMPRVIEEMMDAVAYGYAPMEILWKAEGGLWGIENIVGKPSRWFEFDPENRLLFCGAALLLEPVPENRFLLAQHRPTYLNPYGDKTFSKCFWPATFKKKGWEWWTVFVEKYGGAFMYGQYPNNAPEADKMSLLDALERMISDAVAVAPEGCKITIESLANKSGISNIHSQYIDTANAEMSKAVLGQTLTTEIGDKGSYAAAAAHNLVREDLARADRRRICAAFNRLASVYTAYNFGSEVLPPVFSFVKDEDLQTERAEWDMKLFALGWRPKKEYITREYGIPEADFELTGGEAAGGAGKAFAVPAPARRLQSRRCSCGRDTKPGLLRRFLGLFASKTEEAREKDERLMAAFAGSRLQAGRGEEDAPIDTFVDALGSVKGYGDAPAGMADRFPEPVEAKRFLKRKLDVESDRWDDLKWGEHARAFAVAHSVKAGVVEEIHGLLNKALSEGRSFQDFKKGIRAMMEKTGRYGRADKTKDDKAYINRRTRVMRQTNTRTAYTAARYRKQLAASASWPIWVYKSRLTGTHRRREHIAPRDKVFRYDDPFWNTYYPPNGWERKCYVETRGKYGAEQEKILVLTSDADGNPPSISGVDRGKYDKTVRYNLGREAPAPDFGQYEKLTSIPMPDGKSALNHVLEGYRRDMNNTRVTRGEFKVFLKRVDTRETRIQDINAQVGNLDLQRYQAPRNEGVQDSKIMGIPRHITGNEDQSIPEDRYDELYQVLQEPEHIYENMKSERPLRGREFHVTGKRG